MSSPYLSEIRLFSFSFAPHGWAVCSGQLLPINQNQALFSLLGTSYGGNGTTTFALPDLRGRVPLHMGAGPGLSNYAVGQAQGVETVTLTQGEMPLHTHVVDMSGVTASAKCSTAWGNQQTPVGGLPAAQGSLVTVYSNAQPDATLGSGAIALGGAITAAAVGGSQSHENREPFLALNYCIALQGIFPSRP